MIDLRKGDCLEIMKDITDKSIDMILCDLPYGTTRNKWDSIIPLDKLWEQYERIIKDNGAIILFSQMPFTAELVHSKLKLFKYEWIWEKDNGTGFLNAKKMPLKIHENILVFYKNPPAYNPQMRKGFKPYTQKSGRGSSNYGRQVQIITNNDGERYPIDIVNFKRDKDKYHPTQKPVALLEYLIKTYTNENDIVLDNCMGSGSTGVACVNTNRNFIGIEKDEKYFEIAKQRIEEVCQYEKQRLLG
jgi:site-specific DNA-methyltransferase (adenine-specific)